MSKRRRRLDTSRIGHDDRVIVVSPVMSGRPLLAPAIEVKCEVCGCACWLSRSNLQISIFAKCVCLDCTIVLVRNRGLPTALVPEGSRKDLRAIGLTDAQIESTMNEIVDGIRNDSLGLRTLSEIGNLFAPQAATRKPS